MRLLITFISIYSISYAQQIFCKTVDEGSHDVGTSIIKTPSNEYIISGFLNGYDMEDGAIITLKSDFNVKFKGYRESPNYKEKLYKIKRLSNGKYIAVGESKGDFWVAIIDTQYPYFISEYKIGDTISTGGKEIAYDVVEAVNGYIIVGQYYTSETETYAYMVKVDNNFNVVWRKAVRLSPGLSLDHNKANAIIKTSDGNYVIIAYLYNVPFFMIKIDENGNTLWTKFYNSYAGEPYDILEESNGSLIVTSFCYPNDLCISKFNSNGDLIWTKSVEGSISQRPYSIIKTFDLGYLVVGEVNNDGYIVKFDNNGNVQWTRTVGSSSTYDQLYDVVQTPDSGYLAVGRMGTNMLIVKLDKNGNTCAPCNIDTYGTAGFKNPQAINVSITTISPTIHSAYIDRFFTSNFGNPTPICEATSISELENSQIYLNCKDKIIIKANIGYKFSAKIYNTNGILILKYDGVINNNEVYLDISKLRKGNYLLELDLNGKKIRRYLCAY